jgi:hypothetical protein
MKEMQCCEYGPTFVTYEWAQKARVLQYTRLERLARDKHSILLGPFIGYIENVVL